MKPAAPRHATCRAPLLNISALPFMRSLEIRSGDVAIYDTRCSRISFTVFVISVAGAGFDEVASLVVELFAMTRRTSETWLLATHWVLARASVFFEIPGLGGNAS